MSTYLKKHGYCLVLLLLAFALRLHQLGTPPLRWDEGWSLGLSSLGWGEINRLTALDVHPPLYYALLKVWLSLGKAECLTRFLSVLFGTLTVPLAYVVGSAWLPPPFIPPKACPEPRRRVGGERGGAGLLAALCTAMAPSLIYYAQVSRMFAACVTFLLLATYGLLKMLDGGRKRHALLFILGATASLYTFYYAALILAALLIYAFITTPRRMRAVLASFAAVALLTLPWALYAAGPMLARVGRRADLAFALGDVWALAKAGLFALVFAYGVGWAAVFAVLAILAVGAASGRLSKELTLPLLAIFLTLVGVSLGARVHMFASRYVIVASPYLALLLAWALGAILARSRVLFALGLLLLVATAGPTIADYVYAKPYEVFEPFDPSADWRALHGRASSQDIVFFNVLSLAGTYERYRRPDDAAWSYALRWDPVIESLEEALDRIRGTMASHQRLWFVLYKGTVAANADLKRWLDDNLYPASGGWREDTLYLLYVAPQGPWRTVAPDTPFDGAIVLEEASFTPQAEHGGVVGVKLTWRAEREIPRNYKVFVHLYDNQGQLVAQHDAQPAHEVRPTSTWAVGERIEDRHGLALPATSGTPLRLIVGLYDPATGQRLLLPDGRDALDIGSVTLSPTT
jgi:mannosyltransferase